MSSEAEQPKDREKTKHNFLCPVERLADQTVADEKDKCTNLAENLVSEKVLFAASGIVNRKEM